MADREPTAAEMLQRAGRALNPTDDWRARLAHDLVINPNSVRQLVTGHLTVRNDHIESVLRLVEQRVTDLPRVERELRAWLDRAPRPGQACATALSALKGLPKTPA